MYNRQENSAQSPPPWLVRAEVTIRHGIPVTSESGKTTSQGTTSTVSNPGGVRMVYRWSTDQPNTNATAANCHVEPVASSPSFEFRRGNILFTSTPPPRTTPPADFYTIRQSGSSGNDDSTSSRSQGGVNVTDSGYTSERFSPSYNNSLPTQLPSQQHNDQKCRSTCSIILSTVNDNRTNPCSEKSSNVRYLPTEEGTKYSWDKSWHNRAATHQHLSARCRFSTVPEVCEDCAENGSVNSFTTHFCTRVTGKGANKTASIRKDASSQTTDIESRASSAASKIIKTRRETLLSPNQLDKQENDKQENRSEPIVPIGTVSSLSTTDQEKSDSSTKDDSSKRKSRTVHIDVYCTGTDDNSNTTDSSSSDDDERIHTPMTVFENEDVMVTHTQATDNVLPRGFQDDKAFLKRSAERRCESFRHTPMRMPSLASSKGYESDDVLSSLYPSQFSSYSTLQDLDNVPWSAASSSVALPLDDCDSTIATSSKDTFSDIESLVNSKLGLTPCDSFEYANTLKNGKSQQPDTSLRRNEDNKDKTWRSPQVERKHLLRNRKMREYLEKHDIGWSSGESGSESDESDAVGWSFVSRDENQQVEKVSTARRTSKDKVEHVESFSSNVFEVTSVHDGFSDSTTRSDHPSQSFSLRERIGPFGSNNPSPIPSKFSSRVTSPFTTPQGEKTDHIVKASKFGTVINAFRKPGHHVGPSKNPSCSCEHCRRYFEEESLRGRAQSIGEYERRFDHRYQKDNHLTPETSSK